MYNVSKWGGKKSALCSFDHQNKGNENIPPHQSPESFQHYNQFYVSYRVYPESVL